MEVTNTLSSNLGERARDWFAVIVLCRCLETSGTLCSFSRHQLSVYAIFYREAEETIVQLETELRSCLVIFSEMCCMAQYSSDCEVAINC